MMTNIHNSWNDKKPSIIPAGNVGFMFSRLLPAVWRVMASLGDHNQIEIIVKSWES